MNKPKLRKNGATEFELPQFQKELNFINTYSQSEVTTVKGIARRQRSYRKNGIELPYSAIKVEEYNSIVNFINGAYDSGDELEFKFEKYSKYSNWVEVQVDISEATEFVGGSGTTGFYVSFVISISDTKAR